jgi:hypothetical protein
MGKWCLSTGNEWIFGWVDTDSDQGVKSFTLETFRVDFRAPLKELQEAFRTIFFLILFWVRIL